MKKKNFVKTIIIGTALFFLSYLLCVSYTIYKYRSLSQITIGRIDKVKCNITVHVEWGKPVSQSSKYYAVYANNDIAYKLQIFEKTDMMYLSTSLWGPTGFEVIPISYRINDPAARKKIREVILQLDSITQD